MNGHLAILAGLLKDKGLRQSDIAQRLGYKSASAVGMMLRGERTMAREDLEQMCALAGITLVSLAAMAGDLRVAKHKESVEGAAILDDMSDEERASFMQLLRTYRSKRSDS
jgi:transcriptional regulator with XRE-family HTH domain